MKSLLVWISTALFLSHNAFANQEANESPNRQPNKVFDFVLGENFAATLKDVATLRKIWIGPHECKPESCEIRDGFPEKNPAHLVFQDVVYEIRKTRFNVSAGEVYKKKSDISDIYITPSLMEIGVKATTISETFLGRPQYILYTRDGALIAVRPTGDIDGLPMARNDLIAVLNGKYTPEKSSPTKIIKDKHRVEKTSLRRWKFNDDVEIRLYTQLYEIRNFSQCMIENASFNALFKTNVCAPVDNQVLLYVHRPSFDPLSSEIAKRSDENRDAIWEKSQAGKTKF